MESVEDRGSWRLCSLFIDHSPLVPSRLFLPSYKSVQVITMNPVWTHAAEFLMPALVRGEVGGKLKLSENQETLRIPRQLVYLCGLVTRFRREPPYSKEQTDWFQILQTLYQKETGSSQRVYQLSPTLLPTNDTQEIINRDVKRRQEEIAVQVSKAEESILAMETNTVTKNKKKNTKPARRARDYVTERDDKDDQSDEENQSLPDDNIPVEEEPTLEELNRLMFTVEERNLSLGEWTEVKIKKKSAEHSPTNPDELPAPEEEKNLADKAAEEKSSETGRVEVIEEAVAPSTKELENQEPIEIPYPREDSDMKVDDNKMIIHESDDEVLLLRNKVQQMALELAIKEERLQIERATHAKALRREKEQSHERLQALQLRLYISETRLKIFEDALDQHVEAVANNVAMGSPERRARRNQQEEAAIPLYSRALRK